MTALAAQGAVKRFGHRVALAGVDLAVERGEILALLGPNGAGKSTLVGLFAGLRRPDAGRVRVFGADPREPRGRTRLGIALQEPGFPATLRVGELATLVAAHFANAASPARLLDRFDLSTLAGRQAGALSGGQRRRLTLALAFAGRPDVVILDEPGGDLDPLARRQLWQQLREFAAAGGAVLLTTHNLEEAEALAVRVAVIRDGAILADAPLRSLTASGGSRRTLETVYVDLLGGAR